MFEGALDLNGRATSLSYGANGQTTSQTLAYADGGDKATSIIDSDGRAMSYTYGPGGELLSAAVADVGTFTYSYLGDGKLSQCLTDVSQERLVAHHIEGFLQGLQILDAE